MGTGQVDIFDIRNVIGIFNLRIQEIQTFNQDFFTGLPKSEMANPDASGYVQFPPVLPAEPRFNFNMLHVLSPVLRSNKASF
jgi:hypothetical protein